MTKIFAESDVTIETLDAHLRDSGLVPYKVEPDHISLRTEKVSGMAFPSSWSGSSFASVPTFRCTGWPLLTRSKGLRGV